MKLSEVKDLAKVCFKSDITPVLVGVSGCGKTSIWKQIYKELGFDDIIILRPSLISDVGDLVGLPEFKKTKSGTTVTSFMRPDWLPSDYEKTLIVLDEFNRIQKDVANAIFGLIEAEEPTVGQYKLPKTCKVVATGNPPTDNYGGVLDLQDSAWISRLCFVKIKPDFNDFKSYALNTKRVCTEMISFLSDNPTFFGEGESFEVETFGLNIKDNNRSKEKASKAFVACKELGISNEVTFDIMRGLGGREFAAAFLKYVSSNDREFTISNLLKSDDFVNSFNFENLSNVSKMVNDIELEVSKRKFSDKELSIIANFLVKIPLDTLRSFTTTITPNRNEFVRDFANRITEIKPFKDRLVEVTKG